MVGKETYVVTSPLGHMIYATNMLPRQVKPDEDLEKAKAEYEKERKKQAKKQGELE